MTNQKYQQLKKIIDKLEDEVLKGGEDITSDAFQSAVKQILEQRGFTLEEYKETGEEIRKEGKKARRKIMISMDEKDLEETIDKRVSEEREEIIEDEKKLSEKIKEVADKTIEYKDLEGKPKILSDKEIQEIAEEETKKIKIPEQLTKKDVENIVKPLIPEIPEIPEVPEPERFNQDDIRGLKPDQIAIDFSETDKKIENLKKEMIDYINKATVPSGGGRSTGKGSRFFNWGMPDKGSYDTAIPDDRYAQKKDVGTFIDDETPSGSVNGSNKTFTLAHTPSPITSLKVYVNGQRIVLTTDYSLSGSTITMIYAFPTGTAIRCDYRY